MCTSGTKTSRRKWCGLAVEFAMLVVHSFLHLLGYDDETEEGFAEMVEVQISC